MDWARVAQGPEWHRDPSDTSQGEELEVGALDPVDAVFKAGKTPVWRSSGVIRQQARVSGTNEESPGGVQWASPREVMAAPATRVTRPRRGAGRSETAGGVIGLWG